VARIEPPHTYEQNSLRSSDKARVSCAFANVREVVLNNYMIHQM